MRYSLYNNIKYLFRVDGSERTFLTFFRISISTIALIEFISLLDDLPLFFSSSDTLVPRELMYLQSGYFKYLHPFYQFLTTQNLTGVFYSTTGILYLAVLCSLLLGFFTRFSAVMALILQLIIFRSFSPFNYGYDYFLTMSLFYCCIFPVGNYLSIDSGLFKRNKETRFNYRRVIQIHLAIAYFYSGIAKALDIGWWTGNSVWKALASIDNSFYSFPPILLASVGIGTILLETSYPILTMNRKTRSYAIGLIILMHINIAVILGLYAFSAIMITWNVSAFALFINENRKVYVETT